MKQLESAAQDSDVKEMLQGRQINQDYLNLLNKAEQPIRKQDLVPESKIM